MAVSAASVSAAMATPSPKASAAEHIAAIRSELEELSARQDALLKELEIIEAIPKYITRAITALVGRFGPNAVEEARIREGLTAGLTSLPKCVYEREYPKYDYNSGYMYDGSVYEDVQRISYTWCGKPITYRVVCEDETYREFRKHAISVWGCTDQMSRNVYEVYGWCIKSRRWSEVATFDIRYIPILVAYTEDTIETCHSLRKN